MWPDGWAMNQMTLHMRHAPSSPLQPAVRNKSLTWCEAADCKGAEEGSAVEEQQCLRTRFLQDHPEALHRFTSDLLSLLLQVYGSTVLEKVGSSSVCGAFRSSAVAGLQHFSTGAWIAIALCFCGFSSIPKKEKILAAGCHKGSFIPRSKTGSLAASVCLCGVFNPCLHFKGRTLASARVLNIVLAASAIALCYCVPWCSGCADSFACLPLYAACVAGSCLPCIFQDRCIRPLYALCCVYCCCALSRLFTMPGTLICMDRTSYLLLLLPGHRWQGVSGHCNHTHINVPSGKHRSYCYQTDRPYSHCM